MFLKSLIIPNVLSVDYLLTQKYEILNFNIFTHAKSITLKWKLAPPPLQAMNSEGFKGSCYHLNFDQKCYKSSETRFGDQFCHFWQLWRAIVK